MFDGGTVYSQSVYYNDKFVSKVQIYKNSNQFNLRVDFKSGVAIDKYKYLLQVTTNIFNWSAGQVASLTFPLVNIQASSSTYIIWNIWQALYNGELQTTRNGISYLLPNLE